MGSSEGPAHDLSLGLSLALATDFLSDLREGAKCVPSLFFSCEMGMKQGCDVVRPGPRECWDSRPPMSPWKLQRGGDCR